MKKGCLFMGMLAIALAFGLILAGCPTDGGGDDGGGPAKHTVTFDPNGGTISSGQVVQEVEEGKYAAIPTITPPANKDADGWNSSAASIASPASPITANVTFTAKWKDKENNAPPAAINPLLGAWHHAASNEYLVFTPSVAYNLFPMKETTINRACSKTPWFFHRLLEKAV
jgi:hypothetical protein